MKLLLLVDEPEPEECYSTDSDFVVVAVTWFCAIFPNGITKAETSSPPPPHMTLFCNNLQRGSQYLELVPVSCVTKYI